MHSTFLLLLARTIVMIRSTVYHCKPYIHIVAAEPGDQGDIAFGPQGYHSSFKFLSGVNLLGRVQNPPGFPPPPMPHPAPTIHGYKSSRANRSLYSTQFRGIGSG